MSTLSTFTIVINWTNAVYRSNSRAFYTYFSVWQLKYYHWYFSLIQNKKAKSKIFDNVIKNIKLVRGRRMLTQTISIQISLDTFFQDSSLKSHHPYTNTQHSHIKSTEGDLEYSLWVRGDEYGSGMMRHLEAFRHHGKWCRGEHLKQMTN